MSRKDDVPDSSSKEPEQVNVDYIKGSSFRTIRPDGAIGSITPRGDIQLALFSERRAIPQRMVHELDTNGNLGPVLEKVSRDAVIREIDAAITIDVETAENIVVFLQESLDLIKGRKVRKRRK